MITFALLLISALSFENQEKQTARTAICEQANGDGCLSISEDDLQVMIQKTDFSEEEK